MSTPMTDEEAIRQAILDGAAGDFCDVADVVKHRFGLRVSALMVEQVYQQLKQEASSAKSDAMVPKSSMGSASLPQPGAILPQPGAMPGSAKEQVKFGRIGLELENEIPQLVPSVAPSQEQSLRSESVESRRDRILEFVKLMGGFDAARAAITELEASLKQLMR